MNRKEVLIDFFKYSQKAGVTPEGIGVERIVDDYIKSKGVELMDLVTLLEVLPGKLRDKQEELDTKTEEKNLLEYMTKNLAAEVALKVSLEKVPCKEEGETKDKYSSKDKREKATKTRLINDKRYTDNKTKIINLVKEIKEIERTLEYLKLIHRSAIGKTRLLGRE